MPSGPATTIVVPAYNVQRYLGECLDSLRNQTVWADCRVLVVDDGSTDDTRAVAAARSRIDPAIRVVTMPNGGPGAGAARNHGLDLVDTPFVMFVDGDDELTPNAVELLRTGLVIEGLDLAVGATERFPEGRSWLWSEYFTPGERRALPIEQVPLLVHDARTCNKLYRTSWLRASGLRFAEGIHHQDTVVNVPAMLLADRLYLVGDTVHRYRKRAEGGSVMDSHYTRLDNYWDHLQVIETLNRMRPGLSGTRESLLQAFIARSFQGFSWRAPEVLPAERRREFFERSAAVITTLRPEVVVAATRNAAERAAYLAMFEADFEAFEDLAARSARLAVRDGGLFLDIPATTAEHRELVEVGPTRALACGITADRHRLRLRLRLRIRGLPRPDLAGAVITLKAKLGGRTSLSAVLDWIGADGDDCVGEAAIPWLRMPPGDYLLRLEFRTPAGTAARWVRRAELIDRPGVWEPDEVFHTPFARVRLTAAEQGVARLSVPSTLRLRLLNRWNGFRSRHRARR